MQLWLPDTGDSARFLQTLTENAVPKWSEHYVDYGKLKKQVKKIAIVCGRQDDEKSTASIACPASVEVINRESARFVSMLRTELRKADHFYSQLQMEFENFAATLHRDILAGQPVQAESLSQFLWDLQRWGDFRSLNSTAAVKIIKKYEKKTGLFLKAEFMPELLSFEFFEPKDESISSRVNAMYCKSVSVVTESRSTPTASPTRSPTAALEQASRYFPNYNIPSEFIAHSVPKRTSQTASNVDRDTTDAVPALNPTYSPFSKNWMDSIFQIPPLFYAKLFGVLLVIQLLSLFMWKDAIQESSGHVTLLLQRWIGLSPFVQEWSMYLHNLISSHMWLLLCSWVFWLVDQRRGLQMYCFVAAGFAVKSLAKNLIGSPRVFWLFEQHRAFYCGTGYSLPSGHSMVSSMTLGFAIWAFRRPFLLLLFLAYAVFVFVNVIYIGTHTVADVLVGWTFGLFLLSSFGAAHDALKGSLPTIRFKLLACLAAISTIAVLDYLENTTHPAAFDSDRAWQSNMERVCQMAPGSGARKMQLFLMFSSTPLIAGIGVAWLLHDFCTPAIDQSVVQRILQAVIGTFVVQRSSKWIKQITTAVFNAPDLKFHICNFVDPIWVLWGSLLVALLIRRVLAHVELSWQWVQLQWMQRQARSMLGCSLPQSIPFLEQQRLIKLLGLLHLPSPSNQELTTVSNSSPLSPKVAVSDADVTKGTRSKRDEQKSTKAASICTVLLVFFVGLLVFGTFVRPAPVSRAIHAFPNVAHSSQTARKDAQALLQHATIIEPVVEHFEVEIQSGGLTQTKGREQAAADILHGVVPRILVGGAPLAGKAALAKLLSTLFNAVHVSARELLRSAAASPNATLAAQIQHYTLRGELVPDEIVVPLMLQRLSQPDCVSRGWVIDGFPRTDVQAASVQALEDSHSHVNVPDMLEANALVFLDVSDALVLQRAAALDAQTTAFTGAEPDVFTRRLRAFYDHLNPTLVRFQQAHVLVRLDGSRSPGHVLHHSLLMLRRLFKQRARVHGRLSAAQAASS